MYVCVYIQYVIFVYRRVCVSVCPSNTVQNKLSPSLLSSFISPCSPITIPTCASLQTCCSIPLYFLLLKETRREERKKVKECCISTSNSIQVCCLSVSFQLLCPKNASLMQFFSSAIKHLRPNG